MRQWTMLTLVGADRPGIVAQLTEALFQAGCSLGEASMMRLGSSFTIMMMASADTGQATLEEAVRPVAERLGLRFHADPVSGGLHQHQFPNVQVRVNGADRPGIVAQVTGALAGCGFNILELESDVAGSEEQPVYIMNIQGISDRTLEELEASLAGLREQGIDVDVCAIETLIG